MAAERRLKRYVVGVLWTSPDVGGAPGGEYSELQPARLTVSAGMGVRGTDAASGATFLAIELIPPSLARVQHGQV